ncbi:FAD-dependent oxidoreductase [Actibacterium ureilyticum]|uniref:FAD-dependent oxidoreductase n=1 Tax=Actibacterium ureilyticum TaxID=1590614 RepID=UPI000BAAB957|nr:FAD-dependent oxidoreductase [Actibacterium ureilyticum]
MITVAGAGVAGLACAYELARAGAQVTVFEASAATGDAAASWWAGGMLAPWCEGETADPEVVRLGTGAIDWWAGITPVTRRGTLVLTPPRDRSELDRFARRTQRHQWLNGAEIAQLEPALQGRFQRGLFFRDEAHLNPRRALADLAAAARASGVEIRYGTPAPDRVDVDCRGMAAELTGLRAVRGEMAVIDAPGVEITRTLRLLHPRIPLYLVPRGNGRFMIGATMVESAARHPVTLRSMLELLGAAFALHPALAEASVIETGVGLRPAFADNLPRLTRVGATYHLNGLYRHGFLLAPALAGQLARTMSKETVDEDPGQC